MSGSRFRVVDELEKSTKQNAILENQLKEKDKKLQEI